MYKNASVSFVVDRTEYRSNYHLIKTDALKTISKNHQVLASTDVLIPSLAALHSHLMAATTEYGIAEQQSYLFSIDNETTAVEMADGFDAALERRICSTDNEYPSRMITKVQTVVKQILLENDPFRSLLPPKIENQREVQIEEETRVVDNAFDECVGKSLWMWSAAKYRGNVSASRGPSPVCRSYATIVASGCPECSLTPTPYDVNDYKKRNNLKSCGKLIHDCVVNTEYQAKFHAACMYTAVCDLTQFILCIPFVRIAFHNMFQSIQDISVHPMNNMQWICNFVLTPCKTIAEVITYHVMKGLDKRFNPDLKVEYVDPFTDDTMDRLETKMGLKRKREQNVFRLPELLNVEKEITKILRRNLDAKTIDPQCSQALSFMNSNVGTRNKITTIVFARALEMYFNLLKLYAQNEPSILKENITLQRLTQAVTTQQREMLKEGSKLLHVIYFEITKKFHC